MFRIPTNHCGSFCVHILAPWSLARRFDQAVVEEIQTPDRGSFCNLSLLVYRGSDHRSCRPEAFAAEIDREFLKSISKGELRGDSSGLGVAS